MTSKHDPRRGFLSKIGKLIRTILIALVVAFVVGFTIGTLLRGEVDKPVRYIGARDRGDHDCRVYRVVPERVHHASLAVCTTYPGDVRDT